MSPATHLFASWLIAARNTTNRRDCRLVALAGILPDVDGLGLLIDFGARAMGNEQTAFYERYHHFLLHGLFGGIVITALLTAFAQERLRVALLTFLVFHLHLVCDLVGSRGPSAEDLWPIFYFGPFTKDPMWLWRGQWRLDAWPNQVLSWILLFWCIGVAIRRGDSFVGAFSWWADRIFVRVLRRWYGALRRKPPELKV
jgi:inner membrane protein